VPSGRNQTHGVDTEVEALQLRRVPDPYDDPDALALMHALDDELATTYGSGDREPVDPNDFTPPTGLFLVGYEGGEPLACGGYRLRRDVRPGAIDAEVKRMYVVPTARRRGHGRTILAALERNAHDAGATRAILETGIRSVEAFAMYQHTGFLVIPPFSNVYADSPTNRGMAKSLDGHVTASGLSPNP